MSKEEMREKKLECLKIASELDIPPEQVLDYASKLYQFVTNQSEDGESSAL